jgi:molecular chaperone GrpE
MNQVNENAQDTLQREQATNDTEVNSLNVDDNVAGTFGVEENLEEASAVEGLKTELNEQKDKYLRLFAEFDNFKRRTAKERIELMQTAGREIMTALLDVLDDCERTEKVLQDSNDIEAIKQGVNLVFHKFRTTLEQKGLKAMSSVNEEFDADLHEAITEIPAPTEQLKGKVIDELQKGYKLGDKIIRYAKVVVGK